MATYFYPYHHKNSILFSINCKIHYAQGLTFDCLAFDPFNVIKHDLTYTMLSCIYLKEHLLSPLSNKNFHVDSIIQQKMLCLKTIGQYKLTIYDLKSYREKNILIQSFNMQSLNLHFENILAYQNLIASHVLYLIQNIYIYQ
jgi:hypothetical protein